MRPSTVFFGIIAVAVLFFGASSLFVVHQSEQALVIRLGNVRSDGIIQEPGLYFKIPMIDRVVFYDRRLQGLEIPTEAIVLKDQKRILVDTIARYRISDPLKYYQAGNEANIRTQLSQLASSSLRRIMGETSLTSLLTEGRGSIIKELNKEFAERSLVYGLTVVDVRIRRADFPEKNNESIYNRMRSEREREATELRAQGYKLKQQIQAEADRKKTILLATATRNADILRSEGDAEASRIYNEAYGKDLKFYAFYRSLETYRRTLGEGTTLVLSPDSPLFRYLGVKTEALQK